MFARYCLKTIAIACLLAGFASIKAGWAQSALSNSIKISISDPSISPRKSPSSIDEIRDPAFRKFAEITMDVLQSEFSQSLHGDIRFLRVPLSASMDFTYENGAKPSRNGDACRIVSPWANMTLKHGDKVRLTGVFIWSERQLLRDSFGLGPGSISPYSEDQFRGYAEQFGEALQTGRAAEFAEQHLPADLRGLFQSAPQSTLLPFAANARTQMTRIAEDRVAIYRQVIGALVQFCADKRTGSYGIDDLQKIPGLKDFN